MAKQIIPHNFMMLLFLIVVFITTLNFIDIIFKNKFLIKNLFFLLMILNILFINFYKPTTYEHDKTLVELNNNNNFKINNSQLSIDQKRMYHQCYFYIDSIIKERDLIN
tara:strand:- start:151 stop:477 length:327 start_codon:yes stop_codon:yes gene_type:complete